MSHTFHIPVLGLGFSVDTPLKVARYGINSVASIVDDELVERMRQYHLGQQQLPYEPIAKNSPDHRARRIEAFLNMMNGMIATQFEQLKQQAFEPGTDITRYFELLPATSALYVLYLQMLQTADAAKRTALQNQLRSLMTPGRIDVNIMAKVDKMNYDAQGESTGEENTDALASLRGFALSDVEAGIVLSAGMNPRLYSYLESFDCFFPNADGHLRKQVILKVSDFRSALIQAKFLAKKGIWVTEFRIESGLNCGGHAFATDGVLLGPILHDFKTKRADMLVELSTMYTQALATKGINLQQTPAQRVSVQGGIGTAAEDDFLRSYYQLDATGWGSPFLLVPEATNVDAVTLQSISNTLPEDYYVSASSPLGILFNNFRHNSMEHLRLERMEKGRPGSPCTKKYLVTNTEFTETPICLASREYQNLKIAQLDSQNLPQAERDEQYEQITSKICLCEGLCTSAYIKNDMLKTRESKAVAICPGPNLAYFKGVFTLEQMVGHIYGKINLLENVSRPNLFINELNLYIDYLKVEVNTYVKNLNDKKGKYLVKFKDQLQHGIDYYKQLIPEISNQTQAYLDSMLHDLGLAEDQLKLVLEPCALSV